MGFKLILEDCFQMLDQTQGALDSHEAVRITWQESGLHPEDRTMSKVNSSVAAVD
jgi:hypothetical protein